MDNAEFEGKIKSALTKLDHENDDHWTKGGSPDIATVAKLADLDDLKRGDIERTAPDFKRQAVGDDEDNEGASAGNEGGRDAPRKTRGKASEFEREQIPSRANRSQLDRMQGKETKRVAYVFKPVENIRVRATKRGYYNGEVRDEGDIRFSGRPGSWMEPA